jgi:hypothetical protein
MKAVPRIAALAIVTVSVFAAPALMADEAHPGTAGKSAISASALSPAALARDPLLQQQSQIDDLSSRVDQLEESRTAIDQKSKSAISLGITGSVAKEISITH